MLRLGCAKFGLYTVVGLNGTLVEAKIRTFKDPKCVFQLQNVSNLDREGANAKFCTN